MRYLSLISLMLLAGCASHREAASKATSACKTDGQSASHIAIATRAQASKFAGCFSNYLKLNKLDELNVKVCGHLVIRSNGSVARAKVVGDDEPLSNDLKWCLEQELWKMDYSKLQFRSTQKLSFPLQFEVRK